MLPKDPLLYFLTQRRNPTPFPLALPGSFDEGDLLAALPEVDLVLYTDYGHDDHPLLSLFPIWWRIWSDTSASTKVTSPA